MCKVVAAITAGAQKSNLSPKKVVISLVGTWVTSKNFKFQCYTSTNGLDIVHLAKDWGCYLGHHRIATEKGKKEFWGLLIKNGQLTCISCRPLVEYVSGLIWAVYAATQRRCGLANYWN